MRLGKRKLKLYLNNEPKQLIIYNRKFSSGNFVKYNIDIDKYKISEVEKGKSVLNTTFTPYKDDDYLFHGWSETDAATADILPEKIMGDDKLYLYAVFKKLISITLYNSSTPTPKSEYEYYNNGNILPAKFDIVQPTKTGWEFEGWTNTNKATGGNIYEELPSNINNAIYYALFSKDITVSFNANGATNGSMDSIPETIYYNASGDTFSDIVLPASNFSRTGYTFSNWALNSASGTKYSVGASLNVDADSTMYAIWNAISYTVRYNGNGASSGSTTSSTHTYDTAKALTANGFTKTGYSFSGWSDTASGSVLYTDKQSVSNLAYTQNTTVDLYAKWSANSYTVRYNGNGASSGSTANSSHTYDTAKELTANGFTRSGYEFLGWSTSASGSVVYTDGQSVSNLSSSAGDIVDLYAVWEMTIPSELVVYEATPVSPGSEDGKMNVTVNDGNYVSLSKNPVATWIYYDTGHVYDTGTITINYRGIFKKATIEFYCVPSNGNTDERYGNIVVAGNNLYDSDEGAVKKYHNTTSTSVSIEAHAHNYYDGSFFAIFAYITKITLYQE